VHMHEIEAHIVLGEPRRGGRIVGLQRDVIRPVDAERSGRIEGAEILRGGIRGLKIVHCRCPCSFPCRFRCCSAGQPAPFFSFEISSMTSITAATSWSPRPRLMPRSNRLDARSNIGVAAPALPAMSPI